MNTPTTYVATRTCTVVDERERKRDAKKHAAPLSSYGDAAA